MSAAIEEVGAPVRRPHCSDEVFRCLLDSSALCALCDGDGIVRAASAKLQEKMPEIVGSSISDAFSVDVSALRAASKGAGVAGVYIDGAGEQIPVTLQPLFDLANSRDLLVVLVNDGAPYREAEARRFSQAPFAVMRVAEDGTIYFVNGAAASAFNVEAADELIGRLLPDLFRADDAGRVRSELHRCVRGRSDGPVDVAVPGATDGTKVALRLAMMPDIAPGATLGVVVVVQSSPIQSARDAIRRIALHPDITDWRKRLSLILEEVKTVVSFVHANFGVYGDDLGLFRAVLLQPRSTIRWPARWMELPSEIRGWLDSGRTWIDDVPEFIKCYPKFRDSEVAQVYLNEGIQSSVTLVTRGTGGQPTSALSFCSLEKASYGEADLEILKQLDLEPILLRVEAEIDAEHENFWEHLKRRLASDPLSTLAQSIVTDVAKHFDWDHVSLFRVNRQAREFEMVFQHGRKLPDRFTQPFGKYMLGATLESEQIRIVNDLNAADEENYDCWPVDDSFRAAMTVPIKLHGRIRWILNAESSVTDTFRGPDRVAVLKIVEAVEAGIEQRMVHEIKAALLQQTQQGVVLTGSDGAILEMNDVAARLLGRTTSEVERGEVLGGAGKRRYIHEYAGSSDSRDILLAQVVTAGRRVELGGEDGETRVALATRRDLDERLDTCIWFLTDVETVDWSRSLRFLRETVTDVAQQTRAPLALASTLTQQLPSICAGVLAPSRQQRVTDAVQTMCDRVVAEVGKADITFERLAERLSIFKDPKRCSEEVDLTRCVNEVVSLLPKRDQDRIERKLPHDPVFVEGDGGRLAFVVRSIVANLIRNRPPSDDSAVRLALDRVDGSAHLKMELTAAEGTIEAAPEESGDALLAAYYAAREDASLGLRAVKKVVKAHRGELRHFAPASVDSDAASPWTTFEIVLPLKEEGRP